MAGRIFVSCTDRDHPYTKGYLGQYVETITDASSTAAAEFDNFTAAQIRGQVRPSVLWMW